MGNNGSKAVPVRKATPQEQAILDVVFARDSADRYRKQITIKWDAEHTRAKALLAAGKKEEAKSALRRCKYLKDIIHQTLKQHDQLLQLAESIKVAESQKRTVDALEKGKDALVQLNKEMGGLKRVEKIMEESADAVADEREISDLLGGGLSSADNEVDEELERLEAEAAAAKAQKLPLPDSVPGSSVPNLPLPDAPTANLQPEDVSLPNSSALNSSVPGSPMPDAPRTNLRPEDVSLPNSSALNSSVPASPMPDAPRTEPQPAEAKKQKERQMLSA